MTSVTPDQDALYAEAAGTLAPAIRRLARSVEADRDRARDLEQDIHVALWRSLAGFDGRCRLATWTYRVAHNVAASHVARDRRRGRTVTLEEIDPAADAVDPTALLDDAQLRARLHALIAQLKAPDRSVILLYLEGEDAAGIAAVTGLTPGNVAVKIHRIKALLARHFQEAA